jgi:CRISPR-associated endonuclease/helicase Cas3
MLSPRKKLILAPQIISFEECLAKTFETSAGVKPGISILDHCTVVGKVAKEIIGRMPEWLADSLFEPGSELVAAVHDIGKVSPGFQKKIRKACGLSADPGIQEDLDKLCGFHGAVSAAALADRHQRFGEIVGRHHGSSPLSVVSSDGECYGGPGWQSEREKLISELESVFGNIWPSDPSDAKADALSGLVTVADWIGSSDILSIPGTKWIEKIAPAVDQAGFMVPALRRGLTFEDVFENLKPREIQEQFSAAVRGAGIYILEAPMGIGKTEAALYAAYRMLEMGKATGIYFALPTQLTSDRIYDRMIAFLNRVLEPAGRHTKALLLHGSAWLRETAMGEDAEPGRSWFNSTKRGMLAPFAVGTIDQALMAVMNVRHGFVRSFGLAGKVVILDEVHSYDSYTGTILDALVKALVELSCTVIVLSATLTGERRSELLGPIGGKTVKAPTSYPLIAARQKGSSVRYIKMKPFSSSNVLLNFAQSDEAALEEALARAGAGQQVLWIENTVDKAQEIYLTLSARMSGGLGICGLLHSRFTKFDRERNEGDWTKLYGKNDNGLRAKSGRILVGTQVLEQSLDIDSDFLVTRLAPSDMLFQRIGRLWRHREHDEKRPQGARREAWILSPRLDEFLLNIESVGSTSKVYAPYVLYRTLEVWQSLEEITLPDGIRTVLERTYSQRQESGYTAKLWEDLRKKREELRGLARVGIVRGGKTLPESKAFTRYSELETTEVLLLKDWKPRSKDDLELILVDGKVLSLSRMPALKRSSQWRDGAAELMRRIVSVPYYIAPETPRDRVGWLAGYLYLGDEQQSLVRIAIVKDDYTLETLWGEQACPGKRISYRGDIGYRVEHRKQQRH